MSEKIIKLELLLQNIILKKKSYFGIDDDLDDFDIEDFNLDNKRKKENVYNINGLDEYGLDKDGYNINGIKGTRKKYPNRKISWINDDNDILYDQYGFDKEEFNKGGYDIYGFDKEGLNKDGLNKYGYKKSSGRGLNISSLPILLSKIYTDNSSKELINDIKKLAKNLYKNKQITKQFYNALSSNIFNIYKK